ncbi:MAG: hypothetical protein AMJ92_10055 [candidate division Zixibacteria bacterium SM23_81]|nr:MAG: hypothetical protein AMJ92_10055 [candidate division Zixibacteria bacterium SM23_81]
MAKKSLTWIAVAVSIITIAVHNICIYPWMLDDAFILFRYAENFFSGHGLVYNIGERVEGYTSFLWVVLLAIGRRVGFDIIFFSKLLGMLFSISCILLLAHTHRFIRKIDRKVSALGAVLLGTCGIFTPWATSGMEVTLFAFVTLLSLLIYASTKHLADNRRRLGFLGIICALSTMARPEGVLVFAVIFVDQLVASLKNGNKAVLYLAICYLIIYLPYFMWRYSYYGYLLPNTFYAKAGMSIDLVTRGLKYAFRFSIPAFLLIISSLASASRKWLSRYGSLFILPLVAATYTMYIILVGGDCMPAFRFFAPIAPLLCLVSAMSISLLIRKKLAALLIVTVFVLYNIAQMRIDSEIYGHIIHDKVALHGKEVGLWFRKHTSPQAVIATNTAGSVPFFAKLKTIDMLGMNDNRIAHRQISGMGKGWAGHEKGDGAYVLSRSPDYILFGSSLGSQYPVFLSDKELYMNPAFHRRYSLKVHRLASGRSLWVYEKRK